MAEAQRRREVDLLIVGLGPGGGSAAASAAAAGLSVVGIDRKQQLGSPVQCAEFIPNPMGDMPVRTGSWCSGSTVCKPSCPPMRA